MELTMRINTYILQGVMMPTKTKVFIMELLQAGFVKVSQNGSHLKLKNPITGLTVIVPIHSKEMSHGLEAAIRKQTGIIKKGF